MIKIILKAFLLTTLTLAAGASSVGRAQPSTTTLTGEWVGNSEPPGRTEFLRLSLTENAGEMFQNQNCHWSDSKVLASGWSWTRLNSS